MNPKNMVSGEITAENKARVLALVAEIRTLMPPLISLSKEQRKALARVSDEIVEGSMGVAAAAEKYPGLVPAELCSPVEMRRDHAVSASLKEIGEAVQGLADDIKSTNLGARSDVSRAGSFGYGILYAVRDTKEGLGVLIEKLRSVFVKRSQGTETTEATTTPEKTNTDA
jgi:hypothetical protein